MKTGPGYDSFDADTRKCVSDYAKKVRGVPPVLWKETDQQVKDGKAVAGTVRTPRENPDVSLTTFSQLIRRRGFGLNLPVVEKE